MGKRELRRIEMSLKKATFHEMRAEVLDFFRDEYVGVRGKEVRADVASTHLSAEEKPSNSEVHELRSGLAQLSQQVVCSYSV